MGSVQFELWWAEVTAFTTKTAKGGPKVDVLKRPVLAGDVDLSRLQAERHGPVLLKLLENDPVFPIDDKVKKHMKARDKGIAFPCICSVHCCVHGPVSDMSEPMHRHGLYTQFGLLSIVRNQNSGRV